MTDTLVLHDPNGDEWDTPRPFLTDSVVRGDVWLNISELRSLDWGVGIMRGTPAESGIWIRPEDVDALCAQLQNCKERAIWCREFYARSRAERAK